MYYVNIAVANIHKDPDSTSEVVTQAVYAMELSLLQEQDNWALVSLPDTYRGWIDKKALIKRAAPYGKNAPVAYVKTLWSHIFPIQSFIKHPPLFTAPFEVGLEHDPDVSTDTWQCIRLLDDTFAWVQKGDYSFQKTPLSRSELLSFSKRFCGLPYRWGGTSSFGYDCSGFVQMLFRQAAVFLPRDSSVQAACDIGAFVSKNALEGGDALFFGQEKINHVGLYLGDGKFIHAVASIEPAVIQVSCLSDPYWEKKYACARRFLPCEKRSS